MDSFELNKIAGTFLGAVFAVMTLGLVSDALFHVEEPETQGFAIVAAEGGGESSGGGEAAAPEYPEISPLMASADAAAGESVYKKCATCHTIDNGGANKVGPNLWEILGRPVATHEGFSYSAAMREYGATGAVWDYENLNKFLHAPKKYIPGTAMGFAGLKKEDEIANLLAYMREQAASPIPLP